MTLNDFYARFEVFWQTFVKLVYFFTVFHLCGHATADVGLSLELNEQINCLHSAHAVSIEM